MPSTDSGPPSPPIKRVDSPFNMGNFSVPFERFSREEQEWAGAFTLLDTMETYFDSRIDLLQRSLQKHSDRLKQKAENTFKIRDLSGDLLSENFDKEIKNFRLKVNKRISSLSASWQSAKVVRTREKFSFFYGVMTVMFSSLMFGMAPQWVHIAYTVQGLTLLPMRAYTYKKRAWHYFMFDLCYYVTILNYLFIWVFPDSPALFVACYCLSHGSLASAVITWRNSLVFHDSDKVTSIFVHIYAPFTFTVIRHFYPDASQRFPALSQVPHLNAGKALLLSGFIYLIWQCLYWKLILINRKAKIQSGQRTTSFSFLLNDKRGVIGRTLSSVPERYRVTSFMAGQLVYAVLTELPAVFLLYDSSLWSGIFLIAIFAISVNNGASYYIEVFGRKFERELEAVRKELAAATARSGQSTPLLERYSSEEDLSSSGGSSPPTKATALPSATVDATHVMSNIKKDE